MEQISSDWVLFLDADVRLQPDALRRALRQAIDDGSGLFSLAPRLECDCLAEWMVQPIMASLLGLGFPIEAANDPTSDVAFAAGPFMLFSRQAYDAIGGHRKLAGEVVEDPGPGATNQDSGISVVLSAWARCGQAEDVSGSSIFMGGLDQELVYRVGPQRLEIPGGRCGGAADVHSSLAAPAISSCSVEGEPGACRVVVVDAGALGAGTSPAVVAAPLEFPSL